MPHSLLTTKHRLHLRLRWLRYRLGTLPFSVGLWVLFVSACFYFAILAVGFFTKGSLGEKSGLILLLWIIGKTLRYVSFAIMGVRGWQRIKQFFRRRKDSRTV